VFDIQGKEVQTLVNEKLSPGSYSVEFNERIIRAGFIITNWKREILRQSQDKFLVK